MDNNIEENVIDKSITDETVSMLIKEIAEDQQNPRYVEMHNPEVPLSNRAIINNANNKVLIEVLSPEVVENEKTKRKHKDRLIDILEKFIEMQLFITGGIIAFTFGSIFYYYFENHQIDNHLVNLMFTFVVTYITSVVVELIYMLKYIVHNVFDTSISDLVKLFKEDNKKK